MLDTPTKKRIDDCRDILVGKLPDPKSQIEQITIALIYKFMDDMDKESISFGGKAKFFSDRYEKYNWDSLFDTKKSSKDMFDLYQEAIVSMEKNPNIPQLFRDIFKNAYLPYRDSETLKMFLKTISEFEYTHSEKLGDAFEYLLSVLGSQGDAGQFRTPRHIIDFMTAIISPKLDERILDPACGTAGFLISAYRFILKENSSNYDKENDPHAFELHNTRLEEITINGKQYKGDKLTPDQRRKIINNVYGYDISPDMVRLSLVNMYLHGFSEPHIYEYDTLTSEERWGHHFDVILANPPFMSPKGGIRPHNKFSIESKRSEVLFVDYMVEHLENNGRAAIIVPEGIIFQSGTAYKDLRKILVDDNNLVGIISLPAGMFNPYSGVKTSIIWIDKKLAKKTDKILFAKIEADGFDLGAQRKPVKQNDLPYVFKKLTEYKAALENDKEIDFEGDNKINLAEKKIIAKNDFNLSSEMYRKQTTINTEWPLVELNEVLEYEQPSKYIVESTEYDDNFKTPVLTAGQTFILGYTNEKSGIFEEDLPVIIFDDFTTATKYVDFPFKVKSSAMKILKAINGKANIKYLYYVMQKIEFDSSKHKRYWISQYSKIKIPLPPLSIQEEIVAEIDSYQNIINGAKMVVENYKPKIDIDPDWEMVELGEVCELNPKKSELNELGDLEISFVPMADINENRIDFTPKQIKKLSEVIKGYTYFIEDDVLLAKVTPCFENGKAGIAKGLKNGIGFGSSEIYVLRPNKVIISTWIYLNIITYHFREQGKQSMTGTGGLQRVPKDFILKYKIPLPFIEIQNEIVAQIEQEQEMVNSSKKLIEIFEQKIKDRIARVWGE